MLEHLRDLLNHMAWADAQCFYAWSKGPVEDEELRERWAHIVDTATTSLRLFEVSTTFLGTRSNRVRCVRPGLTSR